MSGSAEDRLIEWLRRRLRRSGADLTGDDCALLPAGGVRAVTLDQQIAGVHFPPDLDPGVVARRLLAVNLSDLAAMAAEPAWAFLALAIPEGFDARRFLDALVRACRRHEVTLAGGDVARDARFHASLTLVGNRPSGGRWLTRDGARPGDRILLGGTVGESAAGRILVDRGARLAGVRVTLPGLVRPVLEPAARRAVRRHLSPRPQLELGRRLGRLGRVAAIDLSDGLAVDLRRLCRESGVGAVVDARALPTAERFDELCRALDADPLSLMLGGGEDYALLFTLPRATAGTPTRGAVEIGSITASADLTLRDASGTTPLPEVGWDHLSGERA